jgi:pSer/pThr/pTyr-binding forkhead associated (FHA) protein
MLSVDVTDLDDQISPSVSRRHAKILFRQSRYLVQDLKSTNGTLVNGHLLRHGERVALQYGDEVQFGDVLLIFIWDSQETSGVSP